MCSNAVDVVNSEHRWLAYAYGCSLLEELVELALVSEFYVPVSVQR